MPLIKCPECGNNVSDLATNCPHCGVNIQYAIGDGYILLDLSEFEPYMCNAEEFEKIRWDWEEKEKYRIHYIQAELNGKKQLVSIDNLPSPPSYRCVKVALSDMNNYGQAEVSFYFCHEENDWEWGTSYYNTDEKIGTTTAFRGQKRTVKLIHRHCRSYDVPDEYKTYHYSASWENELKPYPYFGG